MKRRVDILPAKPEVRANEPGRIAILAVVVLPAALWAYACGDGTPEPPPDPPRPTTVTVTPRDGHAYGPGGHGTAYGGGPRPVRDRDGARIGVLVEQLRHGGVALRQARSQGPSGDRAEAPQLARRSPEWGVASQGPPRYGFPLAEQLVGSARGSRDVVGSLRSTDSRSVKGTLVTVIGCMACGMLAPLAASAQTPGERVRVTLSTAESIVGVFAESRPDELVLDQEADGRGLRSVAHDEVLRMERSLGVRSRWKRGLLSGALGGAAYGVGLGLGRFGEVKCGGQGILFGDSTCTGEGGVVAVSAAAFGLVGAVSGLLVGLLIQKEAWETIKDWNSRVTTPGLVFDVRPGPQGSTSLAVDRGLARPFMGELLPSTCGPADENSVRTSWSSGCARKWARSWSFALRNWA